MKVKRTALLFLTAVWLLLAVQVTAFALPEDDSSAAYTQETVPPYIDPTSGYEPEEPTQAPTPAPDPEPEPETEPPYTNPPVSQPQTDPVFSQEETQPSEEKSWMDIFKLPTQAIPTDSATIPEKTDNTTTTQYVVMGILMWVVIALGACIVLGVLASTHRRKRGK